MCIDGFSLGFFDPTLPVWKDGWCLCALMDERNLMVQGVNKQLQNLLLPAGTERFSQRP
jgi:hypothetical protein